MTTLPIHDLTGSALNWAVAQCLPSLRPAVAITDYDDGAEEIFFERPVRDEDDEVLFEGGERWNPVHDWEQLGPLLLQFRITTLWRDTYWWACVGNNATDEDKLGAEGSTPQLAACRALVSFVLNQGREFDDEVSTIPVPTVLTNESDLSTNPGSNS